MASVNSPSLSNAIRNDVPAINAIIKALAKADPSILSDLESGTKRFYEGTNGWEFQEFVNGSWVTRTNFNIDAQSVDGYNTSVDAVASTIVVRDTSGKLKGNLTGKADTAATADKLASTLALNAGGTGATTAANARTNLGVPPTSHASTTTTYGVSSAANYGHSMASSTTPKALGTAAVGSETTKFARGDHVHPTTAATGSVLGMVKLSDSTTSTSAASAGIAASPKAVKAAMDKANTANTTANTANTTANTANTTANAAYSSSFITKAENPITSVAKDTTAAWVSLGAGVFWFSRTGCLNNQPQQYGFVINYIYGSDVFQIWSSQNIGPVYFRQGNTNGWGSNWYRVSNFNAQGQLAFPNGSALWIA